MSRVVLFALALLVAGVACFLWLGHTERGAAPLAGEAAVAEAPRETGETELRAPEPPGEALSPSTIADAPDGASRTAPLDERARIAGRVCPAGGYPAEESARIVAEVYVGQENRGRPLSVRADVAGDGAFELLVPKDARYALLDLESEDLYLAEAVKARPGDLRVQIVPQLLALLEVRVVAPPGVEADMKRVQLSCWARESAGPQGRSSENLLDHPPARLFFGTQPLADGSFQFAFAEVGVDLELQAESPWGAWHQILPALSPGERREVVVALALDRSLTIAGRVIDEQGEPVAGVPVSARRFGRTMWFGTSEARSGEDGGFELHDLERLSWRIAVEDESLAQGAELPVDGTAGDVRGLVLSVVRGKSIEGTVVWSDGTPAEGFYVLAEGPSGRTGSDFFSGRFAMKRLRDEAYELQITAETDALRGSAHLSGVRPGQSVRAVLESSVAFQVQGTVTDSAGRPVEDFEARAGGAGRTRHLNGGRFVLGGLAAGECEVEIAAKGYQCTRQHVDVGPNTPALSFVLLAAGRIRGTVLDARGNAVANASVKCDGDRYRRLGSAETDSLGRFELEVGSVSLRLHASCAGHGASEVLDLSVESGRTLEGVVLVLRDPCRLEGRVLDADGKPVAGAYVNAGSDEGTQSDERGEFSFDSLAPGSTVVLAMQWNERGSVHAQGHVELASDRTTTIELRFERRDPVRIRGRILRGGRPLACGILFHSNREWERASSDADGRFEVTLPRPGEWTCIVLPTEKSPSGHEQKLVVPDVDVQELELDYDTMSELEQNR